MSDTVHILHSSQYHWSEDIVEEKETGGRGTSQDIFISDRCLCESNSLEHLIWTGSLSSQDTDS